MVRIRDLLDRPVRWTLYAIVRWVPPRRRGLRLATTVDAWWPPTSHLYAGRGPGGARIQCDLRDPVQRAIFYCGIYEPEITRLVDEELCHGDTFVDIGANVGYFSLLAAARVGPAGRVLAFEPAIDLSRRLRLTAARAARRSRRHLLAAVEVHDVALSDRTGVAVLTHAVDNRNGERFLSPDGIGDDVRTVPLGDYLPDLLPDVVKIDVEGAELRVLRGMQNLLCTTRPRLVLVEAIEGNVQRFGDSIEAVLTFMADMSYTGVMMTSRYSASMLAFRPSLRPAVGSTIAEPSQVGFRAVGDLDTGSLRAADRTI